MNNILDEFFEIEPLDEDQFLKVKETLTRMGIPTKGKVGGLPILWQTCHVLHKQGKYYICHHKQLFRLDGWKKLGVMKPEDHKRLEYVVSLLREWCLVRCITPVMKPAHTRVFLKVVSFKEKESWRLLPRYSIGEKK